MRKFTSGIIFITALNLFHAQQTFNLKECIRYGLENHRTIKIKNNETGIAEAERKELRSGYLPSVALNAGVDDNLKVQEQIIPAGLVGDADIRVAFTKKFTTTATMQLDQKIYDQSLLISLKAGKKSIQKAKMNAVLNEEDVIFNISSSYYQILVYRQQFEFLKDNQEIYAEQQRIAELQVDKGVLAEVELYKIKVTSSNNQSQIRLCEKNIANSINELKNAMGFPIDQELTVEKESISYISDIQNSDAQVSFDVKNRTDYQIAEVDSQLEELEYKKIRAGYLPVLSVYAKYGGTGFGDQLGQSFNTIKDFSSIGIKLSVPVFDGFNRKSQLQQAKLKQMNALETLKLDESTFRMEYENAKVKLEQALTSIEAESKNLELAKQVLDISNLQYNKGIIDMNEWLTSQTSLKDSQNNYLNSIVDQYVARIEMEKAAGTIKTFFQNLK